MRLSKTVSKVKQGITINPIYAAMEVKKRVEKSPDVREEVKSILQMSSS